MAESADVIESARVAESADVIESAGQWVVESQFKNFLFVVVSRTIGPVLIIFHSIPYQYLMSAIQNHLILTYHFYYYS